MKNASVLYNSMVTTDRREIDSLAQRSLVRPKNGSRETHRVLCQKVQLHRRAVSLDC
jgi:hypothetical protein